jgi:hypothetical protein
MNSKDFDREFDLEKAINRIAEEDKDLLERLSDD